MLRGATVADVPMALSSATAPCLSTTPAATRVTWGADSHRARLVAKAVPNIPGSCTLVVAL